MYGNEQKPLSDPESQPLEPGPPAKTCLLEPCFVNPSLRQAIEQLLRRIGRCASVTSYGSSEREWLSLTCDGVPYRLMRKVVQEATFAAMKEKLETLGWIDTSKMLVKDLKAVLKLKIA